MKKEIKERIEAVCRGEVPEGYISKNHQLRPADWQYEKIGKYLVPYDEFSNDTEVYPLATSSRQGLMLQSEYYSDQRYEETSGGFHVVPEGYVTYRHMSDDDIFRFNVNKMGTPVLVSPEYPVFTTAASLDQDLLIAYLNNMKEFTAYCSAQKKGSTRTRMYFSRLSEFAMPIPPVEEQKKIAEILAICDRVIELKQQLLEEKRRQKKWLMQKLLDPNAGVNQPECSGVKWITRCIKELGTVITGSTPDKSCDEFWGGDFPWITSQDFTGKYIGIAEVHVTDAGKKKCRVLPAGAVLVTCIASIGLNAIAKVECAKNQQINAVICNGICSEEMLYYIIEYNRGALERIAGKTAVPIISKDQFEKIKVTIPEGRSEQDKITKVLSVADSEIQLLQNELEIWQQKKKALMQLLLTGLVRVNA